MNMSTIKEMYESWPTMAEEALKLTVTHELESTAVARVVTAGMGGSGIVGDILLWLARVHGSSVPFEVVRDPGPFPPGWLNASIVLLVSYSGNTRETLAFAEYALGEMESDPLSSPTLIVALSSGGRLEEVVRARGVPHIKVPGGLLPRASLPYLLLPLLRTLQEAGVMGGMGFEELRAGVQALSGLKSKFREEAQRVESGLGEWLRTGHGVAVVGCGASLPLARRVVAELAENSKIPALLMEAPEAGHNMVEAMAHSSSRLGLVAFDPGYEPCSGMLEALVEVLVDSGGVADVLWWRRGELGFLAWYLASAQAWGLASVGLGERSGREPGVTRWLGEFRARVSRLGGG